MQKFKVHRIVRPLDLGGYAKEYEGQTFSVWVNPKRELVGEQVEIQSRLIGLKAELEKIVERSKQDGVGADLTADVATLDEQIEKSNDEVFAWFATIWSQGKDKSQHETAESVREFATIAADTDPALWAWIALQTITMIRNHREGNRKN